MTASMVFHQSAGYTLPSKVILEKTQAVRFDGPEVETAVEFERRKSGALYQVVINGEPVSRTARGTGCRRTA